MIQNPSTKTNKTMPKPQKSTGSIKRDINLMPANEASEKIARNGTIALAVFVGLLLVAYFVIYMPAMQTKDLQDKAANAKNELAAKQGIDAQYKDLKKERDTLKLMQDNLDKANANYLQPADVYKQVSSTCPDSITLFSMTASNTGLIINGMAANDNDLAQFIVNLRTVPVFQQVSLTSVTSVKDDTKDKRYINMRAFELAISLPEGAVLMPQAAAEQTDTTKGGDGK